MKKKISKKQKKMYHVGRFGSNRGGGGSFFSVIAAKKRISISLKALYLIKETSFEKLLIHRYESKNDNSSRKNQGE
jgi:hypothetical protein